MKAQIFLSLLSSVVLPLAAFAEHVAPDLSTAPVGPFVHSHSGHSGQYLSQFAPPPAAGCGSQIQVTTLAASSQYGAGSAQVPQMLEFKIGADGTGDWVTAVSGGSEAVVPGKVFNIPTGTNLHCNKKLAFRTTAALPNLDSPTIMQKEEHKNPLAVLVFKTGDVVAEKLTSAGVEAPFGDQKSLAEELAPFTSAAGKIVLPKGEQILAFEFGSLANVNAGIVNEAVDYNDAVFRVNYKNVLPQEIALRRSAGESNVITSNNKSFNTSEGISAWIEILNKFDTPSDVKLTELSAIIAQTTSALNFNLYQYRILVWDSLAAAQASPFAGNIATVNNIPAPTYGPTQWGVTASHPFIGVKPTWRIGFDLAASNIIVPAGTGRVIALYVLNGSAANGSLGIMESTEGGDTDYGISSSVSVPSPLSNSSASLHDGRMGINLKGVSLQ